MIKYLKKIYIFNCLGYTVYKDHIAFLNGKIDSDARIPHI